MTGTQRYWDGSQWTDHIAPGAGLPTPEQPANVSEGLLAAGWVTALLLPIIGFVIGCVVVSKRPGQGVGMLVLSVLSVVFIWSQVL